MDISIHSSFLPHDDPEAALAFYRDMLGFEVRNDVGYGGMRWITVGPTEQPDTSIVLYPPFATPGITDDERRTIAEMMAKGSYAIIVLATRDLDGAFERLQASGADVVQEPIDQPYGIRDCAIRGQGRRRPLGTLAKLLHLGLDLGLAPILVLAVHGPAMGEQPDPPAESYEDWPRDRRVGPGVRPDHPQEQVDQHVDREMDPKAIDALDASLRPPPEILIVAGRHRCSSAWS
jgi:uncharacterized glyoxalase superfamily protein PhnB